MEARDKYGGLVRFDNATTIVNDPRLAAEVLDNSRDYAILGTFLNRRLSPAEATLRNKARQHLNAGLRRSVVEELAGRSERATVEAFARAARFTAHEDDDSGFDPLPVLEHVFSRVVCDFYFGTDSNPDLPEATAALLSALSTVFGNPFSLPPALPTPANLRVRAAYRKILRAVQPLVEQRAQLRHNNDFAAVVTQSAIAAGHEPRRICDLLIGSLLAAQRVPAASAAWTLVELAASPEWTALSTDSPQALNAVIVESSRLHPPTWLLRRTSTTPTELGSHRFPAGHNFMVSPYVIHRDSDLFDKPNCFTPSRWLDSTGDSRAMLSFGRGTHRCPGRDASAVILNGAIGGLLKAYEMTDASAVVRPHAQTTLIPEGFRIRLRPAVRAPASDQAVDACARSFSTR